MGLTGLIATIVAAWIADPADRWSDDLWFEVAKAGVQLIAVGILGGALTYAWKDLATNREAEAERRTKIRAELLDLFSLYNDVKSVRRLLRSLGLDLEVVQNTEDQEEPRPGRLSERQVNGFQEQMLHLNKLQLGFESKMRQFGQTDILGDDTRRVVDLLSEIESHLHDVLKEAWERGQTEAGADVKPVSDSLQPLFDKDDFRAHVTQPLNEITRLINRHVFGEASQETQELMAEIEGRDGDRRPSPSIPPPDPAGL